VTSKSPPAAHPHPGHHLNHPHPSAGPPAHFTFLRQYGARPSVILSAMLFAHHRGAEDVGVAILCNKPAVLVRFWLDSQSYNSGGRVPLAFGSMEPKCKKNSNMRPLSNGMAVTSHATDLGSIPGGRIFCHH
jgi:hypothetical protein